MYEHVASALPLRSAAVHAHPADRFAREILAISAPSGAVCSPRLMRNPFGHSQKQMPQAA